MIYENELIWIVLINNFIAIVILGLSESSLHALLHILMGLQVTARLQLIYEIVIY